MGVAFRYLGVSALLYLLPVAENALALYSILSLGVLGGLIHFNLGSAGKIMFKNASTGQVHPISFLLHFPFHLVNHILMLLYRNIIYRKRAVGNEVFPNLWLAGCFAREVEVLAKFTPHQEWACVVDLTCEMSETASVNAQKNYLNLATWDGCPPNARDVETCVEFVAARWRPEQGSKVLIHCAHGVGRSTLVMCAVMVKLGIAPSGADALKLIRASRPIARLNKRMLAILAEWERDYARGGKKE